MTSKKSPIEGSGCDTTSRAAAIASSPIVQRDIDGDETMESPCGGTSNSRWKRDEHARFMLALERYGGERTGSEWRKIAAFVQTRSLTEVRLHGQQYLRHLVQIHHPQHHHTNHQLHDHQQQSRLLQIGRRGLTSERTPAATPELEKNSQNDLNGPNNSSSQSTAPTKVMVKAELSATAAAPCMIDSQLANRKVNPTVGCSTPKSKVWSFEEDKALETALASWQRGKPYSWPKIAVALPGKTAKDVRFRYEQLLEDVAAIEANGVTETTTAQPVSLLSASISALPPKVPAVRPTGRPGHHSTLSSRIAPPPPIQVPPPLSAKGKQKPTGSPDERTTEVATSSCGTGKGSSLLDSPGIFPSSSRSRLAVTPSLGTISGMLSPTFLEFLANEDKPAISFSGLAELPSPLLSSPSVLGGGTRGGALPSPLTLELNTPGGRRSRRQFATPRGHTTPRIWNEFLSDEFKIETKASGPSESGLVSSTSASDGTLGKRGNQVHCDSYTLKYQDAMKPED